MSRMQEFKQVSADAPGTVPMADIRVRVDFDLLARELAKKAMKSRSKRVFLVNGAIEVEAFNVVQKETVTVVP